MLNYIKSYCHILANLPGILARLERELQSKPSATSVAMNSAAIASLHTRLNAKPTQADLTALHSLMGGRLDTLEAQVGSQVSTANLRQDIRSSIANAVANVEAAKLNAEKTGEPNLSRIPPTDADALVSHPNFDLPVVFGDAPAVAGSVRYVDGSPKSKRQAKVVIDHLVKAPKKPRAPKTGGDK